MPITSAASGRTGRSLRAVVLAAALQSIAAAYFLIDGVDDIIGGLGKSISLEVIMECIVVLALLIGIVISVRFMESLRQEIRRQDETLTAARGALAEHINSRFADWRLTNSEGEVALFALKGCDVAEIARLRGSASGTVRAQLSQIYAKAGVTNQAMLVSLFLDDLLADPTMIDTGSSLIDTNN